MIEIKTAILPVTGLSCSNCALTIEKGIRKTPGIREANVDFASEKMVISFDPGLTSEKEIIESIQRIGFGFRYDQYAILIKLGKYLEARAKGKTSMALKALMGMRAKTAFVVRAGVEREIPVNQVLVGNIIVVRPGDELIGSTINRKGMVRFEATKVGKDTALSQIVKMVQDAQGSLELISQLPLPALH